MEFTRLGRTGLKVSVTGLGCGGHSRLGQSSGATPGESENVVRAALDLGINFIDTAAAYGTEEIVGNALVGRRDDVVLSTKIQIIPKGASPLGQTFKSAQAFEDEIDTALGRLRTDYIDVLHLHGVMPDQYRHCHETLVPVVRAAQAAGKVGYLGITERFIHDTRHDMLAEALNDDLFDVVMAGFNLVNPSARHRVFAVTNENDVGTLIMFAVRRALSNPPAMQALMENLIEEGVIAADGVDRDRPVDFLMSAGGAQSVVDGAYRFCRHEPGADVVLTGTGSIEHLRENVASLARGPLAQAALARLEDMFGQIDSVSGE